MLWGYANLARQLGVAPQHDVFHQRCAAHFHWSDRLSRFHLAREQAHHFEFGFIRRNTESERCSFVVGKRQAHQTEPGRVIFDLVEDEHGANIEFRRSFDERADFVVPVRTFD